MIEHDNDSLSTRSLSLSLSVIFVLFFIHNIRFAIDWESERNADDILCIFLVVLCEYFCFQYQKKKQQQQQ